jgi:hypothetical protein
MNLLSLLDLALKSDEVIDVLETFDLRVVYDFDRLRENTPDVYWASSPNGGFELRFNERQVLDTIFMYAQPKGRFASVERNCTGLPLHSSFKEAKATFETGATAFQNEPNGEGWIKGMFGTHSVHYEFNSSGALALVTVMAADA